MTAKTTADAFFHNFIVHYGLPGTIHSDQGANFQGSLIKDLRWLTAIMLTNWNVKIPNNAVPPDIHEFYQCKHHVFFSLILHM